MHKWKRQWIAAAAAATMTVFAVQAPIVAQGRGRGRGGDADAPRSTLPGRVIPQKYEEPAFARGYATGKERGLADARNGERYDPVASREYRDGDLGYATSYGSRDAYKSNYRAGFRQGYEEGYRKR
jgi:hypothetical protein